MCVASVYNNGFMGKVNSLADPLGARLATGDKSKLDPAGLFKQPTYTPAASTTITNTGPQDNTLPATGAMQQRKAQMANSTVLTGGAVSGGTLLGGG